METQGNRTIHGGRPVHILLATFNGERFLRAQIESILGQSYRPVRVIARDDGSSDGTLAILEEYAQRYPDRFTVLPSMQPSGSAQQNFLRLMQAAVSIPDVEYIGFADQDDVWLPRKIELEMQAMHQLEASTAPGQPLLVFSDLTIVDQDLRTLHDSMWAQLKLDPDNLKRLNRIMMQNVVTGSTAVMNRPLAALATRMAARAYMHDWWVALLAATFGSTAAVPEPTVLYRQHSSNVLGVLFGKPPRGIPKWRYHGPRRSQWEMGAHQAQAFVATHGAEMTAAKLEVFQRFLRCEMHPNRFVRAWSWLRGGFFLSSGLRQNLAMLWYLWDMKAAKRDDMTVAG